jgi:transcriptional regulator with XRE-family HTH domain
MGQEVRDVPEEASLSGTGVGHYLASQRRLRGISLDDLAELTKIPRRSLERLEAGSFDTGSDGFVRGFVRAVAVSLGLDPDEAVMRLMDEPEEGLPAAGVGLPSHRWLVRASLLAGLALGLAALWLLIAAWMGPAPASQPSDVILRRDAVRALAGEAAAGAAGDSGPARDMAPAAP